MSGTYLLLQYGNDAWATRFEDLEGRLAFTISPVDERPNLVLKLAREAPWAQQHPDIMGPSSSFFYFGPSRSPGNMAYGNSATQAMVNSIRKPKEGSPLRYFVTPKGLEFKWKVAADRLECFDNKGTVIAVWEMGEMRDPFSARLTIKHAGLSVATELLTTLTLNRIAQAFQW
ncbi:hypothetical protein PHLGIDRAFT_11315 [Phlebiopsis gigantea 11061_1 CR5-6]|uniref:Uncharacterized protein n=1 Tax=Phlebiopsis gigantea (strain 11061_1 CR5-6) TaxID=745531 RepID=A0A0C3S402_PHLG1|nr:hypothetical protein PHLGIDRAFT_11315 [Phlebiopsis gigantea 11061_1 CR5-6]